MLPSASSLAHLGTVPTLRLIFGSGGRGSPSPCFEASWRLESISQNTTQEGLKLFWHFGKGLVPDGTSSKN